MRRLSTLLLCALASAAVPRAASADVLVTIDKATQRMDVAVDGQERYSWPVSTGVPGHDTPSGSYTPLRMDRDHFSKEWDDAPMPNSIFFTGMGHAIHGTGHGAALGRPASHGCVRLSRAHSAELFALVKAEGLGRTRVVVEGDDADASEPADTVDGSVAGSGYGRARYDRLDDGDGGFSAEDGSGVDAPRHRRPARTRLSAPPQDDGAGDGDY